MKVLFYLVLLPLSYLPKWALYALSNGLAFILHRVIGYRRTMMTENMKKCYPERSVSDIKSMVREFYSNLADIIVESIETFSMNEKEALERISFENLAVLEKLYAEQRSAIITGGHYVNWEAMTQGGGLIPHRVLALYKPLRNSFMDEKVRSSRQRFDTEMISIRSYRQYFSNLDTEPKAFIFGIDQSPRKDKGIWMEFLNRDTLVFTGPERLAKEFDLAVVTGRMRRVARGKYVVRFELLTDSARTTAENEITHGTMKDIESQVNEDPTGWLWSHNRWKHSRA